MSTYTFNVTNDISIHAPREGSDRRLAALPGREFISIHAPREGSDPNPARARPAARIFLSTLPARGATKGAGSFISSSAFLSTLPARGATGVWPQQGRTAADFYPRSPRGERPLLKFQLAMIWLFLSTLPARGATKHWLTLNITSIISIHAPREGSDSHRRR